MSNNNTGGNTGNNTNSASRSNVPNTFADLFSSTSGSNLNTTDLLSTIYNSLLRASGGSTGNDIPVSMPSMSSMSSMPTRLRPKEIPVDIVNDEKSIYIYAEMPAVTKESILIDIYNNKVTISSEKVKPYDTATTSEIKYGKIERVVTLPICVTKKEAVTSIYNNGILRIKINKLLEEENRFVVKPE